MGSSSESFLLGFLRQLSLAVWLALFAISAVCRAEDDVKSISESDDNPYETDRPGELENPFTLPPGQAQLVNYIVAMNAAARDDSFDTHASAVFLDTAVRFGLAPRFEGIVTVDTFLRANVPQERGGGTTSGFGYGTFSAKWNFLADPKGEYGIGIAPFVRIPLQTAIGGTGRSESGVFIPFEFDLEGGWEMQGSASLTRAAEGQSWTTQYQGEAELERMLTRRLTAYVELELEAGEGQPLWSTEFGVTYQLSRALHVDLGTALGIGRISRGREAFAGLGWRF